MKLETPQDGWNAAMLYIAQWCRLAKTASAKRLGISEAFEEVAIMTDNMIDTPPKEIGQ